MSAAAGLGFGCASLGSRVSARDGLAALARAADAGIDWFDVAPSYGDGAAETLLGRFLRGRGDAVSVCTKVGILPGRASLPKRLARPALRLALGAAPGLRSAIRRRRPAAAKQPLTPALIAASIDASLARLGVEQVAVLALHDATPDEVVRDDIVAALEAVVAAGKAARIGIASSPAAAAAGIAAAPVYTVAQVANNPLAPGLAALPTAPAVQVVTHSVFGADGLAETVARRIAARPALDAALRAAGYAGDARAMAFDFLPDYAFAMNPQGIVLLSMFSRRHLDANRARHARPRDAAAIARIADLMTQP